VDVRAAAPEGGGTSRRRPQSPMFQRSYGTGPWPSVVWVATWSCAGSKLIDPAGSALGVKFDPVATSERRPRIQYDVQGLRAVGWVVRATRRLGRAVLWLVCGSCRVV
jgi:hypothetical protein